MGLLNFLSEASESSDFDGFGQGETTAEIHGGGLKAGSNGHLPERLTKTSSEFRTLI
jgi:hypothetical protein